MTDDLDLALRSIEGEGPSPDFVARLRERVLAETAASGATTDDETIVVGELRDVDQSEMEIVMLQPNETPNRRALWFASAAAAVVLIVVLGVVALWPGNDQEVITDRPPVDTVAVVDEDFEPAPEPEPEIEPEAAAEPEPAAASDPAAEAWEEIPIMLFSGATGEFRTNTFGVPFRFDTGDMPHSKDWEREDWIAVRNDDVSGWIDVFVGLDSIDATIEEFQKMHDAFESAEMGEPEPAKLGGADGVVFGSVGLPAGVAVTEQDLYEFTAPIPFRWWTDSSAYGIATPGTSSPGSAGVSIWVVDVSGQVVVVAQSALDMQQSADGQALSRQATQSLIESIVWKDVP